ncbi:methyltransferase [Fusarium bulbicola]|nr:methyltransferase [Fusarium bulbicola]
MSSPKSQKSRSPTKSPPGPQSPAAVGQVAEEQAAIEVDDDSDSSYSKSTGITDTESLRSSIMAFKWENGRRYHAYQDGSYWAPNDDRQQEAEDLMHEVYRIILGNSLYEAPISDNPQKVLDIGCGTGIWAIEFADEHPSADVLGVDLSPIQPNFVPPNCRFEVDDITNEWTYPEDTFDFIHARSMIGCLPDWTEFYRKAFKHTKPGGWVESVELWGNSKCDDDTLKPESPLHKWVEVFKKIESLTGKSFFWDDKMQQSISDAGFINVSGRRIKVPIGAWPKDKTLKQWGAWNRHFLLQGLEGFSIRGLTEMLGWKYEDAQLFLADMRKELTNPALHAYLDVLERGDLVACFIYCMAKYRLLVTFIKEDDLTPFATQQPVEDPAKTVYEVLPVLAKVLRELRDLLRKENVLSNWDFQELFLMTSMAEGFNPLEDERLLKVYEMLTLEEFLDRLFPSTAGISST